LATRALQLLAAALLARQAEQAPRLVLPGESELQDVARLAKVCSGELQPARQDVAHWAPLASAERPEARSVPQRLGPPPLPVSPGELPGKRLELQVVVSQQCPPPSAAVQQSAQQGGERA
jgi:hypothetical protein